MAYGFSTTDFRAFHERMNAFAGSDDLPADPDTLRSLAEAYLAAMRALFDLMRRIMDTRLERSSGRNGPNRFTPFQDVYWGRVEALERIMRAFLFKGLEQGEAEAVRDFLEGVRQAALHEELLHLGEAIDASTESEEDLAADTGAAVTVTNSLKEQIERRVRWKFVKDILHAINEAIRVIMGAT